MLRSKGTGAASPTKASQRSDGSSSGIHNNPWGDESSVVHYREPARPVALNADSAAEEPIESLLYEAELALPEPPPQRRPRSRKSRHPAGSVMAALDEAEEPGVYFREERRQGKRPDEIEDPELAAAVEEAIRLLFGVPGIFRIGAGRNEQAEPVVLIHAGRGFTERSMAAVPDRVHRFRTLVAVPYELLPLRRERSG